MLEPLGPAGQGRKLRWIVRAAAGTKTTVTLWTERAGEASATVTFRREEAGGAGMTGTKATLGKLARLRRRRCLSAAGLRVRGALTRSACCALNFRAPANSAGPARKRIASGTRWRAGTPSSRASAAPRPNTPLLHRMECLLASRRAHPSLSSPQTLDQPVSPAVRAVGHGRCLRSVCPRFDEAAIPVYVLEIHPSFAPASASRTPIPILRQAASAHRVVEAPDFTLYRFDPGR